MNANLKSRLLAILKSKSLPVVTKISFNLHGATFWLMKLAVGLQMVKEGLASGQIGAGGLIIESTSGTMGYGLAFAARAHGLKVQLVGDPAIDSSLANLLDALGAVIHIVTEKRPKGGYQVPRLERLSQLQTENPGALWMKQYDNPANARAYAKPARLIMNTLGPVDVLVATTGSGGSISGLARILRTQNPKLRVVAVDTHNSVLFGQPDGPRLLRGLGNSIYPRNLDYGQIDEVHWIAASDAFTATRELFTDYGMDIGPTTGAAFLVARWIAANEPTKSVVFIGPDRAERYLETVYSRQWCESQNAWQDSSLNRPYSVSKPADVNGGWAHMHWARRNLADVQGTDS